MMLTGQRWTKVDDSEDRQTCMKEGYYGMEKTKTGITVNHKG
jgi:hypothetical protein